MLPRGVPLLFQPAVADLLLPSLFADCVQDVARRRQGCQDLLRLPDPLQELLEGGVELGGCIRALEELLLGEGRSIVGRPRAGQDPRPLQPPSCPLTFCSCRRLVRVPHFCSKTFRLCSAVEAPFEWQVANRCWSFSWTCWYVCCLDFISSQSSCPTTRSSQVRLPSHNLHHCLEEEAKPKGSPGGRGALGNRQEIRPCKSRGLPQLAKGPRTEMVQ